MIVVNTLSTLYSPSENYQPINDMIARRGAQFNTVNPLYSLSTESEHDEHYQLNQPNDKD